MRIRTIYILLPILVGHTALGADSTQREWFPTPDGYKWPAPVKPGLGPEEEAKSSELTPDLRNAILESWPSDTLP